MRLVSDHCKQTKQKHVQHCWWDLKSIHWLYSFMLEILHSMSVIVSHWHWNIRLTSQMLITIPAQKSFFLVVQVSTSSLTSHSFERLAILLFSLFLFLFLFLLLGWFCTSARCISWITWRWSSFILSELSLPSVAQVRVKVAFNFSKCRLDWKEHLFCSFIVWIEIWVVFFS